jgi:hypothetical protein
MAWCCHEIITSYEIATQTSCFSMFRIESHKMCSRYVEFGLLLKVHEFNVGQIRGDENNAVRVLVLTQLRFRQRLNLE